MSRPTIVSAEKLEIVQTGLLYLWHSLTSEKQEVKSDGFEVEDLCQR